MFALIDSDWGIILIVVAVLVLFGGSKLPKLFHSLGSAQAEYKRGLSEGQSAESAETTPPQVAPPAVQAPMVQGQPMVQPQQMVQPQPMVQGHVPPSAAGDAGAAPSATAVPPTPGEAAAPGN